ncbi:MAG: PH domain-containing protein [Calditrichaeota bacterium]|nr:PH domain-containing protein [Calditrichota bacterium]
MTEQRLSESALKLWVAVHWITSLGLIILTVVIWIIVSVVEGPLSQLLILPASLLIIAMCTHAYIKVFWSKFRYYYDDNELRVSSGVWWQKQVLVPFSRITNIDLRQGPMQRSRKLATLKIQTAGQGATNVAEILLFSQENYEELRDTLISQVSNLQFQLPTDGTLDSTQRNPAANLPDSISGILNVLDKIEKNTRKE